MRGTALSARKWRGGPSTLLREKGPILTPNREKEPIFKGACFDHRVTAARDSELAKKEQLVRKLQEELRADRANAADIAGEVPLTPNPKP